MNNETTKPAQKRPPTCRELQTQVNVLRDEVGAALTNKVDITDAWTITAAVETGIKTAQRYYERAEQACSKVEPALSTAQQAHINALETLSRALQLAREIERYAALPWYKRVFGAPTFAATKKENK